MSENGKHNGAGWKFRRDEDLTISIYDKYGYVVSVSNELTARRVVNAHQVAMNELQDSLRHEEWGCAANFETWQRAEAALVTLRQHIRTALDILDEALPGCGVEEARKLLEAAIAEQ